MGENEISKPSVVLSLLMALVVYSLTGIFMALIVTNVFGEAEFVEKVVYCPETKEAVYEYKGPRIRQDTIVKAEYFRPLKEGVKQPTERDAMVCPGMNAPLNGFEWWFWARGRHLPRLTFPGAVTLLTKNDQGDLEWWPWELSIED